MNKLKHLFFTVMLFASLSFITSCNPDDDGDVDVRDAVLNWSATGACSQSINMTFVDNKPANNVNISLAMYNSANQVLSVVFFETNYSWQLGFALENMSQLQTGTYSIGSGGGILINGTMSTNCAQGFSYVSGTVTITAVDEATGVGNPGDRYISGTFNFTLEDGNTPPNTITVQGSFSDLYIATS